MPITVHDVDPHIFLILDLQFITQFSSVFIAPRAVERRSWLQLMICFYMRPISINYGALDASVLKETEIYMNQLMRSTHTHAHTHEHTHIYRHLCSKDSTIENEPLLE